MAYLVSDTVLSASYTYFIITTIPSGRYYTLYFTNEEARVRNLCNLYRGTQPKIGLAIKKGALPPYKVADVPS